VKIGSGVLAFLGALSPAVGARAEGGRPVTPFTVQVDYRASAGCPEVVDFKAVVIARLGYDPFDDKAPQRVIIQIRPGGASLDGRLEWRDAYGSWTGEQTFPSATSDCSRLVRAMGFALSVQIQLLAGMRARPEADVASEPELDSGPAPAARSPRPAPPPLAAPSVLSAAAVLPVVIGAPDAPVARPSLAYAMGASAAVAGGLSSVPVPLAGIFGEVAGRRFSFRLGVGAGPPSTTRRADGAGVSQQALLLDAMGCGSRARWRLCLVANVGESRMAGVDIDRPTSAVVPIVGAGARVGVVQPLGRRWFLDAHADGVTLLNRWTAALDQVPVWTAPRFALALGLDVGVRLRGEP
jgi:hypothetical protein